MLNWLRPVIVVRVDTIINNDETTTTKLSVTPDFVKRHINYIYTFKFNDSAPYQAYSLEYGNEDNIIVKDFISGYVIGTLQDDGTIEESGNGIGWNLPSGGTTGQFLAKHSDADYDAEWVNAPQGLPDTTGAQEGDVLTLGSGGPEWEPVLTGDNIYAGNFTFSGGSKTIAAGETGSIILTSSGWNNVHSMASISKPDTVVPIGLAGYVISNTTFPNLDVKYYAYSGTAYASSGGSITMMLKNNGNDSITINSSNGSGIKATMLFYSPTKYVQTP